MQFSDNDNVIHLRELIKRLEEVTGALGTVITLLGKSKADVSIRTAEMQNLENQKKLIEQSIMAEKKIMETLPN